MKCLGCDDGVPVIVVAGTVVHYQPGSDNYHSICAQASASAYEKLAGAVADGVEQVWEGEGGRLVA